MLPYRQQPQRVMSTRWGFLPLSSEATTTPNESLRLVGGFPSVSTPNNGTNTPNVCWVLSFGLHLQRQNQRPQRVISTRWGLPLAFDSGDNDPQRVIATHWGFSFGLHPQRRNQRPQRVSMTRWGLGKFFFSLSIRFTLILTYVP